MATFKINGKNFATQDGTGEPTVSSNVVFPTGYIISMKISEALPSGDQSKNDSSFTEIDSDLRITHTASSTSNKLHFSFYSGGIYANGTNLQINVAYSSDVTTALLNTGNSNIIGKTSNNTATIAAVQEGSMTAPSGEKIYTPIYKTDGGTAYVNFNGANGYYKFIMIEIQG